MAEAPVKRRKRDVVSQEDVYKALRRAGFDKGTAVKMTAVAGTESGYDLGVVRPSTASGTGGNNMLGLFQISDIHKGSSWFKEYGKDWNNLDNQAKMAKAVYDSQGLTKNSWASYGTPAYYQKLKGAEAAAAKVGDNFGKSSAKKSTSHPSKGNSGKSSGSTGGSSGSSGSSKKKSSTASTSPVNHKQAVLIGVVAVVVLLVVMGK